MPLRKSPAKVDKLGVHNSSELSTEIVISIFVPHPHFVSLFGSVRIGQACVFVFGDKCNASSLHPPIDLKLISFDLLRSPAFRDVFNFMRLHHIKARMGEEAVAHFLIN